MAALGKLVGRPYPRTDFCESDRKRQFVEIRPDRTNEIGNAFGITANHFSGVVPIEGSKRWR
ncbi:hypothetical protein D1823_15785 [Ruegeria sp. AD91A]|nr:hypothetical protein D1823_15785 [Ruegeria sp. AD91A]